MKFAWLSNAPWAPTGYGNQTKVFLPRLIDKGHEIAVVAFFGLEGGMINWNGITVFPRWMHAYGQDVAGMHTKFMQYPAMFSLMDAWVINPENIPEDVAWVPWFPIDSDPLPPPVYEQVRKAHARIVFSKFGIEKMNEVGLDHYYVPHGIDTKAFRPEDPEASRERMGWPQDKFVVGMVAANKGNPSRKAFTQNIEAFALLKSKHKDVVLYLHTLKEGFQGVDLAGFITAMGLKVGEDVLFPNEYHMTLGYPDAYMRVMYSAMDVHLLVSMGEGFGIPIVEAQACGVPVIVGDWTSMSELCFSGWKVPKEEAQPVWTPLSAYQYSPNVHAIYELLEKAYLAKGHKKYRTRAREGALAYDADTVTEKYWVPVLGKLEESIDEFTRSANRTVIAAPDLPDGARSQDGNLAPAGAAQAESGGEGRW